MLCCCYCSCRDCRSWCGGRRHHGIEHWCGSEDINTSKMNCCIYVLFVSLSFLSFCCCCFFSVHLLPFLLNRVHSAWMSDAHASTVYSCAPHSSLLMWVRDRRTCAHVCVLRSRSRSENLVLAFTSIVVAAALKASHSLRQLDRLVDPGGGSWPLQRLFVQISLSIAERDFNFANWPKEMVNFRAHFGWTPRIVIVMYARFNGVNLWTLN